MQILPTDSQLASPVVPPAAILLTDEEVVARVRAGDTHVFEILMRRYNQRLYRAARAILQSDAEAEDAVQQAYLNAFGTWLSSKDGRSSQPGS